jgi:hypothetical protein
VGGTVSLIHVSMTTDPKSPESLSEKKGRTQRNILPSGNFDTSMAIDPPGDTFSLQPASIVHSPLSRVTFQRMADTESAASSLIAKDVSRLTSSGAPVAEIRVEEVVCSLFIAARRLLMASPQAVSIPAANVAAIRLPKVLRRRLK